MSKLGAFDELAALYSRFRPDYPDWLFRELAREARQADSISDLALDVGSGTGISTRQLAEALGGGWKVLGVEPSGPMLKTAEQFGAHQVTFIEGVAEHLPAQTGSTALVMAAQAVQWFDRPAFYREAMRVLEPAGLIALIQNNRDWRRSALLDAYEGFLEANSPDYSRGYRAFDLTAELSQAGFRLLKPLTVDWIRMLSASEFLGMIGSSTKMQAAIRALGEAAAMEKVWHLLAAHGATGQVEVPYRSELFMARTGPVR